MQIIDIFLWWAIVAFIGVLLLHALILYGPIRNKIVAPDAHKYPYYESQIFGFKAIPALIYCTPYGNKFVRLYWFIFLSFLPSLGIYLGAR